MKVHLSNEEFTEHLLGAAQSATTEHIASCAACREEAERVARAVDAFRTWAHEESAKQQATNVLAFTVPPRNCARRRVFAWGGAVFTIVVAVALVSVLGTRPVRQPVDIAGQVTGQAANATHAAQAQQSISDDKLLAEVQAALDSSVPRALEPAAVLASERNKIIQETGTRNQ